MNDEISSDIRSQRGLALAQAHKDAIKVLVGTKYLVPSAAGNGSTYVVDVRTDNERCSCLDWSKLGGHGRSHRCKHIFAVIHVVTLADGSELIMKEPPKKKYPRNWTATNVCRTLIPHLAPHYFELLVDGLGLRGWKPGDNGRPPETPLRDVLLVALIRAFYNLTAGEAIAQAEVYWKAGLITLTKVPHYNTLLYVFARPEHMALLHRLLAGSALPLIGLEDTFAVDGTGFGTSVYDHHYKQKHGSDAEKRKPTRHGWAEAKIVFGVRTLCAPAAQVTDQHVGEPRLMPELLRRIVAGGGRVKEWLGDAAYNSWYNVRAVEDVGATPFYDWKEGVTGKTQPETVGRLYRRFKDDEELYWERYGRRSLAESGMHAVKERFGYTLSSRAKPAQFAEVMLRLICHNVAQLIMAVQEFKVDPRYWAKELIAKLPELGSTQPRGVELARLGEKVTEEDEVE
jgi:transposase